ncbi:hypothetical protein SEA_KELA_282 [Streptomyces phage Kela]|nr:hypothetical protein SEA_KELA_282 [Streptomyces phage Kela]
MAVYALYVPSARRPVADLDMEVFPSREVAGNILKQRVQSGTSLAFWVRDGRVRHTERPVKAWPVWDETGYFRVWLRKAADPVPALLERPDEEWLIRETGGLERIPWVDGEESLILSDTGERALNRPRLV